MSRPFFNLDELRQWVALDPDGNPVLARQAKARLDTDAAISAFESMATEAVYFDNCEVLAIDCLLLEKWWTDWVKEHYPAEEEEYVND